ncbi:hypothetical protein [Nostoc sp. UHCC 0252]|nr:hypothetical protein [Nostoc sp. UHCC 0252]MEA5605575.1 hypothetical protein [Nostoc sp. UHCC 0252]
MTLHPRDMSHIPETTAQVARNSFPKGNISLFCHSPGGRSL